MPPLVPCTPAALSRASARPGAQLGNSELGPGTGLLFAVGTLQVGRWPRWHWLWEVTVACPGTWLAQHQGPTRTLAHPKGGSTCGYRAHLSVFWSLAVLPGCPEGQHREGKVAVRVSEGWCLLCVLCPAASFLGSPGLGRLPALLSLPLACPPSPQSSLAGSVPTLPEPAGRASQLGRPRWVRGGHGRGVRVSAGGAQPLLWGGVQQKPNSSLDWRMPSASQHPHPIWCRARPSGVL